VVIYSTGTYGSSSVTLEGWIGFLPYPALVAQKDVTVDGNAQIDGAYGGVHSNGNLTVGASADIAQTATAVGTGTFTTSGTIGGFHAGGQDALYIPKFITAPTATASPKIQDYIVQQADVVLLDPNFADQATRDLSGNSPATIRLKKLADSLGIPPTVLMRVADLSAVPLPTELAESVEAIIDRALARRPDLASRLAALRVREADERRTRAEFWPRLSLSGSVGQAVQRYRVGPPFGTFTMNETEYGAFLNFEWKLFDGFERENALREATSQRGAAEADLAALELRAIREVWKTYADVKTALRKHEYALALLTASEEAYASTFESYRTAGLATVLDMLAAQRDLARARTTEIQSRAELLTTSAALTFAAGD